MAAVPADCVFGQDNVTVSALTPGFPVYAGYYNGPFANLTALRARFPHAYIVTIALRLNGSKGSMAADIEPGTMSATQTGSFADCLAWLKQGGFPAGRKPLIYVMASWAAALERYLAANGWSRESYDMWTAHYAGLHLCSPSGCGYGGTRQADATQYASGANDYNVFRGYVIHGTVPPVPPPPSYPSLGSTGDAVKLVQTELNLWAKACGFGPLIVDGDFGGKTYAALLAFQKHENLAADGVDGPLTAKALASKPPAVVVRPPAVMPPVVPSGKPALVFGTVSKQVAAMQYYLRNSGLRGVRGINADGDFGSQTLTSLKNFQIHCRLSPDGVYGPATAKQLAKYAVH